MEEIWIESNGYKISNYGKVTKRYSDDLQKMSTSRHGYVSCNVKFDDGFFARSVHRAVAYAFLRDTYRENLEVNHIDGNKQNNRVDNLEWVSKKDNQYHATYVLGKRLGTDCYTNRISEETVMKIYNECLKGELSQIEIAKMFDVDKTTVNKITRGEQWKHLGLEIIDMKQKPIVGVNMEDGTILEYKSLKYVDDIFTKGSVSRCCTGKSKTGIHKGYKWMYKKDYIKLNN